MSRPLLVFMVAAIVCCLAAGVSAAGLDRRVKSPVLYEMEMLRLYDQDSTDLIEKDIPRKVRVTSPNGGEKWIIGTLQQIQWDDYLVTGMVTIWYSTSPTGPWRPIGSTACSDHSYPWNVDGPPSRTCRVEIRSVSWPSVTDESNSYFEISNVISNDHLINGDDLIDHPISKAGPSRKDEPMLCLVSENLVNPFGLATQIETVAVSETRKMLLLK